MARLKKKERKFRASTVLEVIVASVLFLILFFLAMEMLVRISGQQSDDTLLQAEIDRQACVQEFNTKHNVPGEYGREYSWGEIAVTVKQYREMPAVQELQFITRIAKNNRVFHFRMLKKTGDEKRDD